MENVDDTKILRRNRPGTKAKNWCRWPDEPLEKMKMPFAVQQYIQQLIKRDPANVQLILKMPETEDENLWIYEHVRQICMQLNVLAVCLQNKCNAQICPQMIASEQWTYLCAAHKIPKECSAIDYTRHTLDEAARILNSSEYFPSKVVIEKSSVAKLGSVCRRLYRIFSHAYFHHRQIFNEFESSTHLCHRFSYFVYKYNLMSKDYLNVPIKIIDLGYAAGESDA